MLPARPLHEPLFLAILRCQTDALGGSWRVLRRMKISRLKDRVDFDQLIHLVTDDGGLRFVTADVECYLNWSGINQMLLEPDGVVVSHGSLFFLVPDVAFESAAERLAFIRAVYVNRSSHRSLFADHRQRTSPLILSTRSCWPRGIGLCKRLATTFSVVLFSSQAA